MAPGSGLRVFGRLSSSNTQKVLWALAELGLKYTLVNTSLRVGAGSELLCDFTGGTPFGHSDEFLRLAGPALTIPVLATKEDSVFESNTIVRFLAQAYGPAPLYDGTPFGFAQASQFMDLIVSGNDYAPCFGTVNHHLIDEAARTPPERWNLERIRHFHGELCRLLAMYEKWLQRDAYLAGGRFSMADLILGTEINRMLLCSLRVAPVAGVQAVDRQFPRLFGRESAKRFGPDSYFGRLVDRPAFREGVWEPEASHHGVLQRGIGPPGAEDVREVLRRLACKACDPWAG